MKFVKHLCIVLVFLCALPIAALAQMGGAIDGTVTDPNGAVVQAATVTATNVTTGVAFTVTNQRSRFLRFPRPAAGSLHHHGETDRDSRPLSAKALKFASH